MTGDGYTPRVTSGPPDEPGTHRDEAAREWDLHRPHGGIADPDHAEFFTVDHRYLPDPRDPFDQPERRQTIDDYDSMVHGAGSRTQAEIGGLDPARFAGGREALGDRPEAEPG